MCDAVELGVELLAHVECNLTVAEAVDRIETVTTDPRTTREILEIAERRGLVRREDGELIVESRSYVSFERDIVKKEGEFECRRCGAGLSTGHFIQFDAGELGPFGSSCIRTVTGRD